MTRRALLARGSAPASLAARYLANIRVRDQFDRRLRFYDDLVKGRTVLINFMFTTCDGICPRATANLAKVQDLVPDLLGNKLHMLSVSVDPVNDTPRQLARYAAAHHARPGWYFLTGTPRDMKDLRVSLGAPEDDKMQHTGLVTIGNDPVGRWRHFYSLSSPIAIAEAVRNIAALSITTL